jgi:hypothetical protein
MTLYLKAKRIGRLGCFYSSYPILGRIKMEKKSVGFI